MIKDKKALEMKLSSLIGKDSRKIELEQYQSSSSLVSLVLWSAYLNGDISGKKVADLGCGNGIFGIGALLLGAKHAVFLDLDASAIKLCKENVKNFGFNSKAEFVLSDVSKFSSKVDTILMNPPFGVHVRKADKIFLEKGFEFSNSIYSIHKIESVNFISKICAEWKFNVSEMIPVKMQVKKSYSFHKLESKDVDVGIWILKRI